MKHKLYQISSLILILGLTSCEGFLDRTPLDQLTDETFYKTVSDANLAVISVYSSMQDIEWHGKGWMITEIPSDNTQAGGTDPEFTPIDNFTVVADNPPVANYWAIHYRQVNLANIVMSKVEAMEVEQAEKDPIIAEARFLRAIAYFDLVRIYGGVPLVTEAPEYGQDFLLARASVREVYDLIIEDLEFAKDFLPLEWAGGNIGRATKGAALAYLSKVYLTDREYIKARDAARAVINSGTYRLMDDFAENFELTTSDNNAEAIFQIQYSGCGPWGTGNALQAFFSPWGEGITKDRDGWGSQIPTAPIVNNPNTTIVDAFEPDDLRKNVSVMTPGVEYPSINPDDGGYEYPSGGASASASNIKKYVVGSGSNICFMSTPQNAHLVRYSDVLLSLAESIAQIDGGITSDPEALGAFNEVRARAGLAPLSEIDLDLIFHERRVEFAFEGQRWFDLLRSGKAMETMLLHGKNIAIHNLLFPIPAGELEINPNLEQNPGY